jgi:hypothetical protein
MQIKSIVIEGNNGDVAIEQTPDGAMAVFNRYRICEITRNDDKETRYEAATKVAKAIYGTDRKGRAAATNSMIHEVLTELDRVAGC